MKNYMRKNKNFYIEDEFLNVHKFYINFSFRKLEKIFIFIYF